MKKMYSTRYSIPVAGQGSLNRISGLLILTFMVSAMISCQSSEEDKPATPVAPTPASRAMDVDVFVAREQHLESIINATGSLLPNESVQVVPERAGKLVSLHFQEASFVNEGDLLAKIDDLELNAQLNKLKVQESIAIREEERAAELRKIDAIPQDEFERLQNSREQIQAEIKLTEVQLEKTNVKAPFSGIVGLRNVSLGAYVGPSQSIVELQQTNPLKLEFDVPEKYMQLIKPRQKVSFEIVGFEQPFTATVYATSTDVTPSTRSFKVRARCPNPNGLLKPGNFAKVEVITGTNEHAIMLPSDAVVPVIDGQKIFLAKSGKVEERLVTTGIREGIMIEIVSGVNPNDTVIVSGLLSVAPGMPLRVANIVDYSTNID